ncbi:legumain [Nephila pilipes]|uniref:legumain n=1 Tax=Nephila pilipes TaxID=299642 RepID=A0A8X6PC42_NEPPI|nr:legumain [Nephila pilipes]
MIFRSTSLLLLAFATTVSAFDDLASLLDKPPEEGKIWAVLAAGSSTWLNYRHQADVCHAYQILKNHGIPDDRIIVMMTDDIAYHKENPTPGIIINHPNGNDVYKGVPKDYTGSTVTSKNFMAILRGDKKALHGEGSGKVLESGRNDHVFIYFADHGTIGGLIFSDNVLSSRELFQTICYMFTNRRYDKMVIYIEACYAGSMFENILPTYLNVYATVSAGSGRASHACYYDNFRKTYLGDSYSVGWMEDSDKKTLTKETLHQQYNVVKKETRSSNVQEFGDLSVSQLHVSEFQGRKESEPLVVPNVSMDLARSDDVPMAILKRRIQISHTPEEHREISWKIIKIHRNREFLSGKVKEIVAKLFPDQKFQNVIMEYRFQLKNFECYDKVQNHFNKECFSLPKNEYALRFMVVLVNICEIGVTSSRIITAMNDVCTHPPIYGIV